jgi:hypothetical protein
MIPETKFLTQPNKPKDLCRTNFYHRTNQTILSTHFFFIKIKKNKLSPFLKKLNISQTVNRYAKKNTIATRIKLSFYRHALLYTFDGLFFSTNFYFFQNFRSEKSYMICKNYM